jgi:Double zinc ribbon
MNRFSDGVRIISPVAWIIATLVAVAMFACLFFVAIPHDAKLSHWPFAGAVAFAIWPGALLFLLVMLAGYVNADARRRGMRHVLWTQGRANFAFCPQCGAELTRACPACKRSVDPGWSRCAYCGSALPPPVLK